MVGGLRTGSWSYKTARTIEKFALMRHHEETCDNMISALKLMKKPAEGWRQSSWENCYRIVAEKDDAPAQEAENNHEAVKVGE